MSKITVLYPIEVPEGDYCWKYGNSPHGPCQFFDCEGGHSKCDLNFWDVKDVADGVLKAPKCKELKRLP